MPTNRGGTSTTNYSDCLSRKCPYLMRMTANQCLDCKGDFDVGGTFYLGGSSGVSVTLGEGAPSDAAAKGSLYINVTGNSATTRLYINTDGSTTWTAVTTSA